MSIVYYRCVTCKAKTPVSRGRQKRPQGHIKTMWCFKCRQVTQHRALGRHG